MSTCTARLLVINVSIADFLSTLSQSPNTPIFTAKVANWAFRPIRLSVEPLLTQKPNWDIFLVTAGLEDLTDQLRSVVSAEWNVTAELISGDSIFKRLLDAPPQEVTPLNGAWDKPLTANNSKHPLELRLTKEMQDWVRKFGEQEGNGQVSMFNLLAYKEGRKEGYMEYIKEFIRSAGARRGGGAKFAADILSCSSTPKGVHEWDDMILAQYPSIYHFAEMLASEDYQEIDRKHRAGNLIDTFILCTTELALSAKQSSQPSADG